MLSFFSSLSIESVTLFVVTLIIITRIQYSRAQICGYYEDQPLWNGSFGTLIIALILPLMAGFALLFLVKQDKELFAAVPVGFITAAVLAMIYFRAEYPDELPVLYDMSKDQEKSISHAYFFIYAGSLFGFVIYAKEWLLVYPLAIGLLVGYLSYFLFKKEAPYKQYDDIS